MSSKIEQLIDEIEEYIDGCKFQALSGGSKIIVEKETIDDLLRELRMKTPEEIKIYQKVIKNREQILNDARSQADAFPCGSVWMLWRAFRLFLFLRR